MAKSKIDYFKYTAPKQMKKEISIERERLLYN